MWTKQINRFVPVKLRHFDYRGVHSCKHDEHVVCMCGFGEQNKKYQIKQGRKISD